MTTSIPRLYHLICDYGVGDPAFSEVIQRFHELDPEAHFNPISIPAFSTISTGFWIAQLSVFRPAKHTIVFSNTAPRHDNHEARENNAGESFVIVELVSGAKIGVVNAGYALSFVKPFIKQVNAVQTSNQGSQFRSRDFFPRDFYRTLVGEIEVGEEIPVSYIPDVPANKVAAIDGYGNIKTTITRNDVSYEAGEKLQVIMNGVELIGTYTDGMFNIGPGVLTLAPGSSGDPENPFLEIFQRRGSLVDPSAADIFNDPMVESDIVINPLNSR